MFTIRLWHYKLLPVLPDKFIIAEWRECIAIKRQWEKGTLKHRLVSYVMDYDKVYFLRYVDLVLNEMYNRKIKWQNKYYNEIFEYCYKPVIITQNNDHLLYKEHNDRYLNQCYYNLQEKADRGIITNEEWQKIDELYIDEMTNYIRNMDLGKPLTDKEKKKINKLKEKFRKRSEIKCQN